ncbi:MAG: phosphodiester glycosidase family protein [Thermoanaerobaculia bacterium]
MLKPAAAILFLIILSGCIAPEERGDRLDNDSPSSSAAANPSSSDSACTLEWRELEPGLRHRSHCDDDRIGLHLVEIDPRLWILDAVRVDPTTAPVAARESGARFAINANFFDPERRTLGVIVSAGERVQRPHPVSWQSIFYVTGDGTPAIVLPMEWEPVEGDARMAVQAGPRIVVRGRRNEVAQATPSLRSGVCLPRDRRVIFFVTGPMSFYDVHEMVEIAALPEDDGGLGCLDAMLFDGGPSAQMHLEGSEISMRGDRVPAFVIARPRDER